MNKRVVNKNSRAKFHISFGPQSLFERVKREMVGCTELDINGQYFSQRVRELCISQRVLVAIRNFDIKDWELLSVVIDKDTYKTLSASWARRIRKQYYEIKIGRNDFVENIFILRDLDKRRYEKDIRCYVRSSEKLYSLVDNACKDVAAYKSALCKGQNVVDWRNNPFSEIEKKLPINVVKIDALSRMAQEILKDPAQNWPKRYSEKTRTFKLLNATDDLSYCVTSFVHTAIKLSKVIEWIDTLYINGTILQISGGWIETFQKVVSFLMNEKAKELEALNVSGLLRWMCVASSKKSPLERIYEGTTDIRFGTLADLCARLQWLLMMTGYNLDSIAVRYKPTKEYLNKMKVRRSMKQQEQKKKSGSPLELKFNPLMVARKSNLQLSKSVNVAATNLGQNPFEEENQGSKPRTKCVRFDEGTYIVQNGVVVFVRYCAEGAGETDSGKIIRSDLNHPEEWNGYGILARESNGRFGGIIAEDWAD